METHKEMIDRAINRLIEAKRAEGRERKDALEHASFLIEAVLLDMIVGKDE